MKIERIKIKNYKVLQDVDIKDIPDMAVFLGKNGSGKSTLFDVFGFLNDSLNSNVKSALQARGGFKEVRSREQAGDIEFEFKYCGDQTDNKLVTYELKIGLNSNNQPIIKREILKYRRGQHGQPWNFLDFSDGEGVAIDEEEDFENISVAHRTNYKLDSSDILAIKGLGQFQKFKAVATFRKLIEDWHVSDFHVEDARMLQDVHYDEQLNKYGNNLANVAKYIHDEHPHKFELILDKMKARVPGITSVNANETEDGRIVLKFGDGKFKDPFASKFVSDGTIKMFAYLILLHDPKTHALLCIEEPENQLYPELLKELVEEFREYTRMGGQVFVSTHSPDFLNNVDLNEVYYLVKKDGYSKVIKAKNIELVESLVGAGDKLGCLWQQGILGGDIE
ncbi:MAG: AAA family ATPase [Methanosarcinales archaeon]|jgi:predicted ATPase|nr:AAA family ATPase [Methanosarcinales archaeon]